MTIIEEAVTRKAELLPLKVPTHLSLTVHFFCLTLTSEASPSMPNTHILLFVLHLSLVS